MTERGGSPVSTRPWSYIVHRTCCRWTDPPDHRIVHIHPFHPPPLSPFLVPTGGQSFSLRSGSSGQINDDGSSTEPRIQGQGEKDHPNTTSMYVRTSWAVRSHEAGDCLCLGGLDGWEQVGARVHTTRLFVAGCWCWCSEVPFLVRHTETDSTPEATPALYFGYIFTYPTTLVLS